MTQPSTRDSSLEYKKLSNLRVIKNLVVLSAGCLLAFCAYDALVILQSTINQESGIGVISVAVQFGCSCITALLLPEYLFQKIGCKSVIVICLIMFVPYIASNFYAHWSLMIPSSIIIGLANSLYWAAQSAYLNHLSIIYSRNKMEANQKHDSGARFYQKTVDRTKDTDVQVRNLRHYGSTGVASSGGTVNTKPTNEHSATECSGVATNLNTQIENSISTNNKELTYTHQEKTDGLGTNSNTKMENGISTNNKELRYTHQENTDGFVKEISESPIKCEPRRTHSRLLESTTARFFGIHGLIYQTCHVWGNLLSYYVLRSGAMEETPANNTQCECGIDFCNIQTDCSTNNLKEPREDLRNILIGVFVVVSVLAVGVVLFFLDELEKRKQSVVMSWEYLAATCKQVKDRRQLLLIPMSLNVGVMQGFVMGDFTRDYVACAWGVHHVGLVSACLGATLALSSSVSGYFVKHLGRRAIFVAAKGVNVAAVVALVVWKPSSSQTFMFFVVSGVLGAVLGTFWSQLRAFYGVLFKGKEGAAFANYQLWHAIGMASTFAYSNLVCTSVKVGVYLALSTLGLLGYLLAEKLHSSDTRRDGA